MNRNSDTSARESFRIQGLGPILDLTIEPRDLTIIVGPQASGKSLVAQTLYFFRDLKGHIARRFTPGLMAKGNWENDLVRSVLDDLRGVPFGYFANKTAVLKYSSNDQASEWLVRIYWINRRANVNRDLRDEIRKWAVEWSREPMRLPSAQRRAHVFIPTERSLFTRLIDRDPGAPFSERTQSEPMRSFASILARAGQMYDLDRKKVLDERLSEGHPAKKWMKEVAPEVLRRGRAALRGEAYIPISGEQVWRWRVHGPDGEPVKRKDGSPIVLRLDAIASGQSEAWPFFVVTAVFGWMEGATFYFEEPESHLHPEAQVAILDTIAYLVRRGCRFVVTTHSPFLLFHLNNLLQAHRKFGRRPPKGVESLDPERVAAYRLGVSSDKAQILDRSKTGLIDAEELERVADELGARFDELL